MKYLKRGSSRYNTEQLEFEPAFVLNSKSSRLNWAFDFRNVKGGGIDVL
jgi:hypothetical protein